MVGAEAVSPHPTVPSAASIRTSKFCAVAMVMPDMATGALSGSATGIASTRRMRSGPATRWSLRGALTCFCMEGSGLEARIEKVAQAVAEQVEREHREADGGAGEQDHPGRLAIEVGGVAGEHQSPGRRRLGDAKAEEGERGFEQDRLRDEGGEHDEEGRDHV